jgi:hypothetical protein
MGTPTSRPPSARRLKDRPDLAQVVIDDRLATHIAQRLDQLTDPLARHVGLVLEQPANLVLERIQLRARRCSPITRRVRRAQRRPHRVATQPVPPRQRLDRDATNEVLASQLGPLLHANQPLPPLARQREVRRPSDASARAQEGSNFDHRRGVSFQPAPTNRRTADQKQVPQRRESRAPSRASRRSARPAECLGYRRNRAVRSRRIRRRKQAKGAARPADHSRRSNHASAQGA